MNADTEQPQKGKINQESQRLAFSISEAARLIGVSDRHLWRFIRAGELPVVPLGTRVLVRKSDIESFLASRAIRSPELVRPDASERRKATKQAAKAMRHEGVK